MLPQLDRRPGWRTFFRSLPPLAIWSAACAWVAANLSDRAWEIGRHMFLALGTLQLWRLSTMGTHIVRSLWFQFRIFPRCRREADAVPAALRYPSRLVFIIPTYREKPDVSRGMLRSVLAEAL